MNPFFLGIDVGTSGVRAVVIDRDGTVCAQSTAPLPPSKRDGAAVEQKPDDWWDSLRSAVTALHPHVAIRNIIAMAVDATSGTVLLADAHGHALTPALMYNDSRATEQARIIAQAAPRESAAHGTASGLAKLLWLQQHADTARVCRAMHQADWVVGRLTGRFDISDANSAIKTGYDARAKRWPAWLHETGLRADWLPQVVEPGTRVGTLTLKASTELGLPPGTQVAAGTSDSTAAILATGAQHPGDAVTSLGSTLVCKVVSDAPAYAPEFGVYSQPYGDRWLVGGGSSSGGAVLRHFFSDARMAELTSRLQPEVSTGLDYYPLLAPGERFPENNPALAPRMTPRPEDDAVFFQGLLEGIARIERRGYERIAATGAPWPTRVLSVGGGAMNQAWTQIRARLLGVPVIVPSHQDAAYGAALLARRIA